MKPESPAKETILLALSPSPSSIGPIEEVRRGLKAPFPFPLLAPLAFLSALPSSKALSLAASALNGGFTAYGIGESGGWVALKFDAGDRWNLAREAMAGLLTDGFLPCDPGIILGKGPIPADAPFKPGRLGSWTMDVLRILPVGDDPLLGCVWETVESRKLKKGRRDARSGAHHR